MTLQERLKDRRDTRWALKGSAAGRGQARGQSWRVSLMVSLKTRRVAAPVIVACVGMLGTAASADAAGGLSVTPASLEHRAKVGTVGSVTLNNTTNETLRVTIVV